MEIQPYQAGEIIRYASEISRRGQMRHRVEVDNLARTTFDELKTVQRYAQIELKSAIDQVSDLRNTTESTNGSVTVANTGEYKVETTAVSGAFALLESGERGRYLPGYEAECGVGIRIPDQTWTGTAKVEWGYFDETDGIGFGLDSGGVYVWVKRSSVVTDKVYQADWIRDTLDGSGGPNNPSGFTLDLSDGNVTQIEFVWYGYGAIQWYINVKDPDSTRGSYPLLVHSITPSQQTSVSQPNLPISVRIENGDQATAHEVYVGGRQFSIYGEPVQKFRVNGERRVSVTINAGVWTPIISFRRKSGRGNNQSVNIFEASLLVGENMFYSFISGGTLTGASFGDPQDQNTNETVCEVDRAATAISGGAFVGGIHIANATQGAGSLLTTLSNLDFDFVNSDPVTLVARTVDGTSGQVTAATFNVKEAW